MKAVFLDRDGTLVEDKQGYLYEPEKLKFLPGAIQGLKLLQRAGYALIIITNQSGIARGKYGEKDYLAFRQEMHSRLKKQNIKILAEFYCPHHPAAKIEKYRKDCNCRKPKPGMLEQAIAIEHINPEESWTIGDKPADIEAGLKAGTRAIGIISRESTEKELASAGAEFTANNLEEAAKYILTHA